MVVPITQRLWDEKPEIQEDTCIDCDKPITIGDKVLIDVLRSQKTTICKKCFSKVQKARTSAVPEFSDN
jgi:hypothetical protein